MVSHHHHKIFVGITSIIILVVGLFLGFFLTANLELLDLVMISIGLSFTSVVLLLIIVGLVLEIREDTSNILRRKK